MECKYIIVIILYETNLDAVMEAECSVAYVYFSKFVFRKI